MVTIRNIKKRRQLAEAVYKNYNNLTEEKKQELGNEVMAAIHGYEMAMQDIIQIIVDDKNIDDICAIKNYICEQLNGKATRDLFKFTEVCNNQMKDYINSVVLNELTDKGKTGKEAKAICESFINYPSLRKTIIEQHNLSTIRICEHCGAPVCENDECEICEN